MNGSPQDPNKSSAESLYPSRGEGVEVLRYDREVSCEDLGLLISWIVCFSFKDPYFRNSKERKLLFTLLVNKSKFLSSFSTEKSE